MVSLNFRRILRTAAVVPLFACALTATASAQSNLAPCPTDQTQRYNNCYGVSKATNGDVYRGEFQDDKRSGLGSYQFSNGAQYFGEFKDDEFNGRGIHSLSNGDSYVGEYIGNKANGRGTYTFKSGDKYSGDLKNWQFNGQLSVIYVNGDSYLGSYEADKRKGYGVYTWSSGARYAGSWENGLPNSVGVLTDSSGKVVIGAEFTTSAEYDSEGYIASPDVLSYSGGTPQREARKGRLIEEVEAGSRAVQVYDDFTWRYSRSECLAVVEQKLFFCGDTSKWKMRQKKKNEDSAAEYTVDDRNFSQYIYEKAGKTDGLDPASMRQAILGYFTEDAQQSGEAAKIVEEGESILWGGQKANIIVVATRSQGFKFVFAYTYIIRDTETLQIITISVGDQYTDSAKALHEEFVNSTVYE